MFRMKSIFLKKVWWVLYRLNRILSGQKLQTDVQRKDMELSSLYGICLLMMLVLCSILITNKKILEFISKNN